MSKEIMQQALDALDNHSGNYLLTPTECDVHEAAINALSKAIAQPVQPTTAISSPPPKIQYVCPVRTIADLVNNLLMMDQALPIYGAQYIDHPTRGHCAIAVSPTVSRECLEDSRWIGKGETLNAAIIWTRAAQPAAPVAQADLPNGWVLIPDEPATPTPDYAECARQATMATGLPSQYPGSWLSIFIREINRWCLHANQSASVAQPLTSEHPSSEAVKVALGIALSTLMQIGSSPRNKGARRAAFATAKFIETQLMQKQGGAI